MIGLVRGQKVKVADFGVGESFCVAVALQHPRAKVDICCFGLDSSGRLSDNRYFIFHNHRSSPDGAIACTAAADGAREAFAVELGRLPNGIQKLVFVAAVEGAAAMSESGSGWLRVLHSGNIAAEFPLTGADYGNEKALILGEIYKALLAHLWVKSIGSIQQRRVDRSSVQDTIEEKTPPP